MATVSRRKIAVLLVNLGTPDAPTAPAVRRYLREFLSDPRVVEVPRMIWWFVLNLVIAPLRAPKSAHAYASVWTDRGSPLLVHSSDLAAAVQEQLDHRSGDDADYVVRLGMRYGSPSVRSQLEAFQREACEELVVLPLYPQYSAATAGSTYDALWHAFRKWRHVPAHAFIADYHRNPAYIEAVANSISQYWKSHGQTAGLLLFSFHGLPARSRALGDPYYDQCVASATLIARRLGLDDDRWQMVFQSRFGPMEWLKPYCVEVLGALPVQGVRAVDVVCPGFAVDCLETLEEIALANREVFMAAGGADYRYIPALNSSPQHAALIADLVSREERIRVPHP
ncbi:MAG: ferrochelatase [Gammaproteobacteria bacterium]|nr:ferrochelatase [Gammaproteobacteria bacterium]